MEDLYHYLSFVQNVITLICVWITIVHFGRILYESVCRRSIKLAITFQAGSDFITFCGTIMNHSRCFNTSFKCYSIWLKHRMLRPKSCNMHMQMKVHTFQVYMVVHVFCATTAIFYSTFQVARWRTNREFFL